MTRTTARATGALALVALAVVLVAAPARAAAYRYWTYWQAAPGADAWSFATQGPGTAVPADGAVEGWAFGLTTDAAAPEDAPGMVPDFSAICGDTAPAPGSKRVGLVVDPGSPEIAPAGQTPPALIATCVVAPVDASGYEVLRSVVEVRTDSGLVCAVAGYPTGECAPVLDDAEAAEILERAAAASVTASLAATAAAAPVDGMASGGGPDGSGTPAATIGVGVLLVAGVVVGIAVSRRRRGEVPDA